LLSRRQTSVLKKQTGVNLLNELGALSNAVGRELTQNLHVPIQAHGLWQQNEVIALLKDLGLPGDTPLSILGVELLPEPNGTFSDPLGGNLGQVRILRTSALYPVGDLCC
jgi:hypothetical protein